jgi:hypothetical protein
MAAHVLRDFVQAQRVAAGEPALSPEDQAHLIKMVRNMTPREVSGYPQAHMDEAALSKLNAELAQLPTQVASSGG